MKKIVNDLGITILFFATINVVMGITSIKTDPKVSFNIPNYQPVTISAPVSNDTIIQKLKEDIKKCDDLDHRVDELNNK